MNAAIDRSDGGVELDRNDRLIALVLFLIAYALVFPNLGDRCLWQDEAETALVADSILRPGLPRGWDGRLLVTQLNADDLTNSFLWAGTPWLMHYAAALGMAVFGRNSFGARWPFALLGCLSFPFFYCLVRRMSKDRLVAVVAVIVLLTSVQYLLLMRQCRYYALLPVLFFLSLWGYQLLPSRRGVVLFSLGLTLLFHSNYVSCAIAATGFLLHTALFPKRDAIWGHLALCGLIIGACSVPWLVATEFLNRVPLPGSFGAKFLGTLIMSNRYVCSWLVLTGLGIAHLRKQLHADGIMGLCVCLLVPMFFFLPATLLPNPRYVAFLLPIGALIAAKAICEMHAWKPWLGLSLGAVLIGSNILVIPLPALIPASVGQQISYGNLETGVDALKLGLWRSELGGYAFELTHPCRGPDEALVSFVEANTAPDDIIGISNDWLPVMFHTGRRIAGVVTPEVRMRPGWDRLPLYLFDARYARWLILRPQSSYRSDAAARDDLLNVLHDSGIVIEKTIHLDINDVTWINNPILSKHFFRMPDSFSYEDGIDVLLLARSPIQPR
jgi:hypothetical protein